LQLRYTANYIYLLRHKGSTGEHKHTKHVKSYMLKQISKQPMGCGAQLATRRNACGNFLSNLFGE